MDRTRTTKWLVLAAAVPTLWLADISPQVPHGLTLVRHAHAIVGAPLTPVSVAGVARRTTRRVVVAESEATAAAVNTTAQQQAATAQQQQAVAQQQAATAQQQQAVAHQQAAAAGVAAVGSVVNTLPAGCAAETKDGVEYHKCGNAYYRAAFQGNNLVYVVVQP